MRAGRLWEGSPGRAHRPGRARRAALMALLALGASACGGVLSTSAGSRFEARVLGEGARPAAVQVTSATRWEPAPGPWAASVGYSPSVAVEPGASPLVRHRAAVEVGSGRASGLRPWGSFALDYGTVRPGDLAPGDVVEALPKARVLESYAVRVGGGWRGRLSRRTQLTLGAGVDRSAGVGSSSATLPELTRATLTARGEHLRTRALTLDGGLEISRQTLRETALLVEADARATLRPSRGVAVSATVGGAAVRESAGLVRAEGVSATSSEVRPVAGIAASWDAPGGRWPGVRASVATRPELDRLDGGLRQRLHAQASLASAPWRDVRLDAGVQWAGDIAGAGERRSVLAADVTLSVKLTSDWSAETGVRAFLQGGATAPGSRDPSEARVRLGLSHRLGIR